MKATTRAVPQGDPQADTERPPFLFLAAFLLVIAIAAPFLGGFENIIGIIIIGIGLYEAWKFNQKRVLSVTGPHVIATPQLV